MLSTIVFGLTVLGFGAWVAVNHRHHTTYYRPALYIADKGAVIEVKDAGGRTKTRQKTLRDLIEQRCPSSSETSGRGHLQTAYSVVEYDRTLLRTRDGGTLLYTAESTRKLPEKPVLFRSHEAYAVDDGGLGYRAIVVNFRGCAGVPVTSPQLYSAGHTEDIRAAMFYIRRRYPKAPLLGLGFSLGANVLTRYVAEEGDDCRLAAACVIACPWDLVTNSEALEGTAVVKRHAAALSTPPSHPVAQAVAPTLALQSPTLETFDETFNRIAGGSSPPFPFPSARAYYTWASSHTTLRAGRTPRWFESGADGAIRRWFTRPVLEWLEAVGRDMVVRARPGKPLREVDGFLMEVGRDDVGCKRL
ncbi:uncharacterized protein B0H18DRAFT_1027985, partial [Fomitopsis serialis]|uniref:uncharacterized protein n=1 Tax=Fomitopsis serialis TaxID=139415 RepID=UPI0020082299